MDFLDRHGLHLALAVAAFAFILAAGLTIASELSSIRNDGRVTLSATPQAIGNKLGRRRLLIHNNSDSFSAAFCGYSPNTLDASTPGEGTGDRLGPGEGIVIADFADQELYCIGDGVTDGEVSYQESYVRTSTPTATPTSTPTVTP